MKVTYDPEADAMYIYLKKGEINVTKELDENTLIDINKAGEILGIEILFVKERNPDLLKELKDQILISA